MASSQPYSQEPPHLDEELLAGELLKIFRRGIKATFVDRNVVPQQERKITAEVVKRIDPELWANSPTDALKKAVERAVSALPSTYPIAEQGGVPSKISWQEIGAIVAGLRPVNLQHRQKIYDSYVDEVKVRAGFSASMPTSTFRTNISYPVRLLIAQQLLSMARTSASLAPRPTEILVETGKQYVHRKNIENQFQVALDAALRADKNSRTAEKTIVFIGQAGMGKTWLVREAVCKTNIESSSLIHFDDGSPIIASIQEAFVKHRISVDAAIASDARTLLTLLCCAENAPPILIFDNLNSTDDLLEYLPYSSRSIIIATCRLVGRRYFPDCASIFVDQMSPTESAQLIQYHSPQLTETEISWVVSAFRGYPLVLRHVCGLINQVGYSVDLICDDLLARDAHILANFPTEDGTPLLWVLKQVLDSIVHIPLMRSMLKGIALFQGLAGLSVSKGTLWSCIKIAERRASPLDFENAIIALRKAAMIYVDRINEKICVLEMHPLTAKLLLRLFDESRPARELYYFAHNAVLNIFRPDYSSPFDASISVRESLKVMGMMNSWVYTSSMAKEIASHSDLGVEVSIFVATTIFRLQEKFPDDFFLELEGSVFNEDPKKVYARNYVRNTVEVMRHVYEANPEAYAALGGLVGNWIKLVLNELSPRMGEYFMEQLWVRKAD